MANPQKEHGYTAIANEILETIQQYKFNLNELKIVMCIWRFTYGFQRKDHEMSLTFIENHTGINRGRVNAALKNLEKQNIIRRTQEGGRNRSNKYAFNKDYETWKAEKYAAFGSTELTTSARNDTSYQDDTTGSVRNDTTGSLQDDTTGSVQNDTQERNTKEIYKEKDKEIVSSSDFKKMAEFLNGNGIIHRTQIENPNSLFNSDLNEIYENYRFEEPEQMIIEASKEAYRKGKPTWAYTFGILRKWYERGIKTTKGVEELKARWEEDKREEHRRSYAGATSQSGKYAPEPPGDPYER
jgi:phage replication O-like protein O